MHQVAEWSQSPQSAGRLRPLQLGEQLRNSPLPEGNPSPAHVHVHRFKRCLSPANRDSGSETQDAQTLLPSNRSPDATSGLGLSFTLKACVWFNLQVPHPVKVKQLHCHYTMNCATKLRGSSGGLVYCSLNQSQRCSKYESICSMSGNDITSVKNTLNPNCDTNHQWFNVLHHCSIFVIFIIMSSGFVVPALDVCWPSQHQNIDVKPESSSSYVNKDLNNKAGCENEVFIYLFLNRHSEQSEEELSVKHKHRHTPAFITFPPLQHEKETKTQSEMSLRLCCRLCRSCERLSALRSNTPTAASKFKQFKILILKLN